MVSETLKFQQIYLEKHAMKKRRQAPLLVMLMMGIGFLGKCTLNSHPVVTPLPPGPLPIEFNTPDGARLAGKYYPAAANPAPVAVLMHGGGGRMQNWVDIGLVAWLQNRGGASSGAETNPLPPGCSYAVFIFTYSGDWIEAGRAALETAKTLPGADPRQILAMGASVGADDAAEACAAVDGCLGALSFSPVGSLDGVRYADSVAHMDQDRKLAWCIATDGDHGCPPAQGRRYRAIVYSGMAHGLQLFTPGRAPAIWQDTRAFLENALAPNLSENIY